MGKGKRAWTGATRTVGRVAAVVALALGPVPAHAQKAIDTRIGRWAVAGSDPVLHSAGLWGQLLGPVGYGVAGFAFDDRSSAGRSLYGLALDLTLLRHEGILSPYAVGGLGFAVESGATTGTAAVWSAGAGLEWNPLAWLGLAVEVRRLAEDRTVSGFWDRTPGDRLGWLYSGRLSIRWGSGSRSHRTPTGTPPEWLRAEAEAGVAEPLSESGVRQATLIVETALGAMGEPYRWGGTRTEHGFDCSGLIWYSYGQQGVGLPRVTREQARVGRYVLPDVGRLEPGDILLFAARRDAITHVGLYIGRGKFIHATTSGGVRIGALDVAEAEDRWWIERWVGARRVLQ